MRSEAIDGEARVSEEILVGGVAFHIEILEPGDGVGGIGIGPTGDGGAHVIAFSADAEDDGILSGHGTPGIVKVAILG